MDRQYYQTHHLTLARHPSETDERMMVRIVAFALFANEALSFANGISSREEPDLWHRDLTGSILLWIDVGQPDPKLLRQAAGRARQVVLINYGERSASKWWADNHGDLDHLKNLNILRLDDAALKALVALVQPRMKLQATLQDELLWLGDSSATVQIEPLRIKH